MNTKLCLGVALFWCLECQSLAFAKRYDPGVDNDVSATCSAEGFCLTVGYTGKAWKPDECSDPIALSPDEYFKRDAFGRFSAYNRASQASYIPSLKANEVQFALFRLLLE
ncbi:hypothetical protein CC77DRAFT_1004018 [Alternaria alternata]|uniref:Uncharacterized protein n=1 Tax=Alternaria alternata TaxID=5599 RepID=A0A177E211_ALTAL|nr:hypothetical protein CC77DRAFT_1004018 [Alternaria alternata]OAG25987.1 hypothetical protein CC77DRAFT_1004018 [Alternaria alternata]